MELNSQFKATICFAIIILTAFLLLIFGTLMSSNFQLIMFGPIIGLGGAIFLVFQNRSILPLFIFSLITQIFLLHQKSEILSLTSTYKIAIASIFFLALSFLSAKVFTRLEKFFVKTDIEGVTAFFLISILGITCGTFLPLYFLLFDASLSASQMLYVVGFAAAGQYIGSVLCIPLIRNLFSPDRDFGIKQIKRMVIPLWVVFGALFLFLNFIKDEADENLRVNFQKISVEASNIIESQLVAQEVFIEGVATFIATKQSPLTEYEFKNYVRPSLIRYPMVQGISWLAYLKPDQLASFVKEQQKIYPNYAVKAIGGKNQVSTNSTKSFYAPVAFIEPFESNKGALGFDISSNSTRLAALEKSQSNTKIEASAPLKLVQGQADKAGILLLKWIPGSKSGPGFVSEVLRLEDFVGLITANLNEVVNIRMVDAESQTIIFDNNFKSSDLSLSVPLVFGGRVIDIDMSPTTEFINLNSPIKQQFFMSVLIALILSLTYAFLMLVLKFQSKIEEQVDEKTWELNRSEEQLKYVLAATGDGIWDWDIRSGAVIHNRRWLELLGLDLTSEHSTVDDYKSRIYPEDLPKVLESINFAMQTGEKYVLEYRMIREDKSIIWVSDIGMVVDRSTTGEPLRMVGAISDITLQKESQAKIEELAFFDPVTNLPNRRYIQDRIQRAIDESARNNSFVGLMLLDLNNFKLINDTYGHYAGDVLLKQFGARLSETLRPLDVVARIGGDEFTVLFEKHYHSYEQCRSVLELVIERLYYRLSEGYEIDHGVRINIKPSIGVVIFGKECNGFEEVMKFADLAMYNNKANPSEKYRFYDQMLHDEFTQMSEMSSGLLEACALEQFYIDYQPVANREKQTVAFEALARWRHPSLGIVMPDKFIAFAEKYGHIDVVEKSIFKQIFSCPAVLKLKEALNPSSIMINLSGIHLMNPRFADTLVSMVKSFDFPMHMIHLEVTEGVFLDNKEQTIKVMENLRAMGFKFALDDFGTGYSSFSYLQKLPIDYLKIDKSFVAGMSNSGRDEAIVKNIITLAHTLNLEVIAEGVETETQFRNLYDMGCDYFQGWYIGRPGPL